MKALVVELDPRVLSTHPANIRRAKGDLGGLVASVRQLGILQPIVVEALADGGHQVLAGHRRLAAALKVGLEVVPVRVVDLKDNPSALAMLAENTQRKDLTVAEEAAAYLQLEADGMEVEEIARQAGVDRSRVEGSIKVTGSKKATAAAHKHDLTLEQTLVLAEFDGDAKAVKKLTEVAIDKPGQFDHTAATLRDEAKDVKARKAALAQLEAKGVRLAKKVPRGWGYQAGDPLYLEDMAGAEPGSKMTEAAHRDCPGHAGTASLDHYTGKYRIRLLCEDPKAHGHKLFRAGRVATADQMTPEQREVASAERREVIANNKAWGPATEVRRQFVRGLLARKAPPRGTLRFAVEQLTRDEHWIARGTAYLLDDVDGHDGRHQSRSSRRTARLLEPHEMSTKGSDGALPMALLAQVCIAAETTLEQTTWRRREPELKAYLEFLVSAGYALAPVEELITKGEGQAMTVSPEGEEVVEARSAVEEKATTAITAVVVVLLAAVVLAPAVWAVVHLYRWVL